MNEFIGCYKQVETLGKFFEVKDDYDSDYNLPLLDELIEEINSRDELSEEVGRNGPPIAQSVRGAITHSKSRGNSIEYSDLMSIFYGISRYYKEFLKYIYDYDLSKAMTSAQMKPSKKKNHQKIRKRNPLKEERKINHQKRKRNIKYLTRL